MRHLLPALLLLASSLAGAGQARLQVSATILSRCQSSAASIVQCGPGPGIAYRMTRDGQAITVEF